MKRKKIIILVLAIAAFIGVAYAGIQYYLDNIRPPKIAPAQVVEQYFSSLQKKDFKLAYSLVSQEYYHESVNQFIDRVSMYDPDMILEVSLEKIEEKTALVEVHIVVPLRFGIYESDSTMQLVRAKREWKIIHP